ncbi:MAG TPA: Smr/MutS family protein [Pyrinomonadaceae bacterium]|jgi:DNA-nicking Smr family endonuclease|nr:Smr/MutS family protein [Pyrinomonadaceae bacterium]
MKLSELLKNPFGARRREARTGEENSASSFGNAESTSGKAEPSDNAGEPFDAEQDVDPFNPFPESVELEITDVFDLHSIPPREVRLVVEEYLSEARRRGFRVVRIIHGKGVGVQREIVRSVLARTPFVERFADAPAEAGGWGATVAFLKVLGERKNADG